MMPIVSRKSSTGIPVSAWTFLKTWSDRRGFPCGAVCPPANAAPVSPTTAIPIIASSIPLNLICLSLPCVDGKNDAVIIVGFSFRARAVTPRRFEGVVEFEEDLPFPLGEGAKREPDRAKPQERVRVSRLAKTSFQASPYRARAPRLPHPAPRHPLPRGTTAFRAPYDGFSQETNQSMAARRESPLTECPVSFCTRNTNFSFAPALAYASEALFAASITPARGVSESESPLITIKGRGAMSGSMAGPSNSE